jgi:ATP-binding cassette, subfamily B, bacterial
LTAKHNQEPLRRTLNLLRAVRLVWESAPGWTAASVVLVIIQGILPLLSLYLMKLVLDSISGGLNATDKGQAFAQAGQYIVLAGAVALIAALVNSLAGLVGEAHAQAVTDHVHDILHAKSIELDLAYYENAEYYDTLHRAQKEAIFRPAYIVNELLQIGQSGASALAMAALLLSLHWAIALILLVTALPGVLVKVHFARLNYRWQKGRTSMDRLSWYYDSMLVTDEYAKEIRLFELGPLLVRRFRELRAQLRQEKLALATRRGLADLLTQVTTALAIFGSYAFIGYRTIEGLLTLGDLVMYYQAFQRGQSALQDILRGLASLYEDSLFLSYLYDFLDQKPNVTEPAHPERVPRPMQTGIRFDHVSFGYPNSERHVLEDVSLSITPGQVVALVGENGAGKTTLVKLLCRLYDPTAGQITLDGLDLRRFETTDLRREMSVVFQDYAHYNLTAQENIWFGNVQLPPDDEQIAAAARRSGADAVIARLHQRYQTVLGKLFRDGEELSIGEWQKIALARAFLRDAQLLVLDEPTSALDARAEYEVFQRFRELIAGRSAVLISHRLSSVRMADRIYVLDGGRMVESGTHDELMALGGKYARLFETQAQYYR